MFKVGDKVKIINVDREIVDYKSWFWHYCRRFADTYDDNVGCMPSEYKDDIFTIVQIAEDESRGYGTLCAIQHLKTDRIYLFVEDGLKLVNNDDNDEQEPKLTQVEPKREFNIGDRVRILRNHNYEYNDEWFLDNAPKLAGKFAYRIEEIPADSVYSIVAEDKDGFYYAIQECDKPLEKIYLTDKLSIKLTDPCVGDMVTVVDPLKGHDRCVEWFKQYAPELGYNFCFSKPIPENNDKYKILKIGRHQGFNIMLYAIENTNKEIYLIEKEGIEPVN